jgi:selenoprotein W-related protein
LKNTGVTVDSKPSISIEYCTVCNFLGRAAWIGQELLAAYGPDIADLTLVPRQDGAFIVRFDGEEVFSYREADRFPEPRELKELLAAKLGREPKARHQSRQDADSKST